MWTSFIRPTNSILFSLSLHGVQMRSRAAEESFFKDVASGLRATQASFQAMSPTAPIRSIRGPSNTATLAAKDLLLHSFLGSGDATSNLSSTTDALRTAGFYAASWNASAIDAQCRLQRELVMVSCTADLIGAGTIQRPSVGLQPPAPGAGSDTLVAFTRELVAEAVSEMAAAHARLASDGDQDMRRGTGQQQQEASKTSAVAAELEVALLAGSTTVHLLPAWCLLLAAVCEGTLPSLAEGFASALQPLIPSLTSLVAKLPGLVAAEAALAPAAVLLGCGAEALAESDKGIAALSPSQLLHGFGIHNSSSTGGPDHHGSGGGAAASSSNTGAAGCGSAASHPLLRSIHIIAGTVAVAARRLIAASNGSNVAAGSKIGTTKPPQPPSTSDDDETLSGWMRLPMFGGDQAQQQQQQHVGAAVVAAAPNRYATIAAECVAAAATTSSLASGSSASISKPPPVVSSAPASHASDGKNDDSSMQLTDDSSSSGGDGAAAFAASLLTASNITANAAGSDSVPVGAAPTARGVMLRSWLQSKTPLNRAQLRKKQFPEVEVAALVAYIRHAPPSPLVATAGSGPNNNSNEDPDGGGDRTMNGGGNGGTLKRARSPSPAPTAASMPAASASATPLWREVDACLRDLEAAGSTSAAEARFASVPMPAGLQPVWSKLLELRRWLQDRYDTWRDADPELTAAVQVVGAAVIGGASGSCAASPPVAAAGDDDVDMGGGAGAGGRSFAPGFDTDRARAAAAGESAGSSNEDGAGTPHTATPSVHPAMSAMMGLVPGCRLDGLLSTVARGGQPSTVLIDALSSSITGRLAFLATCEAPSLLTSTSITTSDLIAMSRHAHGIHTRQYAPVDTTTIPGLQADKAHGRWMHDTLLQNSSSGLASPTAGSAKGFDGIDGAERASFVLTAINLYAREGWAAPPSTISKLRMVRAERVRSRVLGLQALQSLMSSALASGSGVLMNEALAGLIASLQQPASGVDSATLLALQHPLTGCDGAGERVTSALTQSYRAAVGLIASLAASMLDGGNSVVSPALVSCLPSLLRALNVSWRREDAMPVLVDTGLMACMVRSSAVMSLASLQSASQREAAQRALSGLVADAKPWTGVSVRDVSAALSSGTVSMMDLLVYMYAASVAAVAPGALSGAIADVTGLRIAVGTPEVDETTDPENDVGADRSCNAPVTGSLPSPSFASASTDGLPVPEDIGIPSNASLAVSSAGGSSMMMMSAGSSSMLASEDVTMDGPSSSSRGMASNITGAVMDGAMMMDEPDSEPVPPGPPGSAAQVQGGNRATGSSAGRGTAGAAAGTSRADALLTSLRVAADALSSEQVVAVYAAFLRRPDITCRLTIPAALLSERTAHSVVSGKEPVQYRADGGHGIGGPGGGIDGGDASPAGDGDVVEEGDVTGEGDGDVEGGGRGDASRESSAASSANSDVIESSLVADAVAAASASHEAAARHASHDVGSTTYVVTGSLLRALQPATGALAQRFLALLASTGNGEPLNFGCECISSQLASATAALVSGTSVVSPSAASGVSSSSSGTNVPMAATTLGSEVGSATSSPLAAALAPTSSSASAASQRSADSSSLDSHQLEARVTSSLALLMALLSSPPTSPIQTGGRLPPVLRWCVAQELVGTSAGSSKTSISVLRPLLSLLLSSLTSIDVKSSALSVITRIAPFLPPSSMPTVSAARNLSLPALLLELSTACHLPTIGGSTSAAQAVAQASACRYLRTALSASDVAGSTWGPGTGDALQAFACACTAAIRVLQRSSAAWSSVVGSVVSAAIMDAATSAADDVGKDSSSGSRGGAAASPESGVPSKAGRGGGAASSGLHIRASGSLASSSAAATRHPHAVTSAGVAMARGVAALHVLSAGWERPRPGTIVTVDAAALPSAAASAAASVASAGGNAGPAVATATSGTVLHVDHITGRVVIAMGLTDGRLAPLLPSTGDAAWPSTSAAGTSNVVALLAAARVTVAASAITTVQDAVQPSAAFIPANLQFARAFRAILSLPSLDASPFNSRKSGSSSSSSASSSRPIASDIDGDETVGASSAGRAGAANPRSASSPAGAVEAMSAVVVSDAAFVSLRDMLACTLKAVAATALLTLCTVTGRSASADAAALVLTSSSTGASPSAAGSAASSASAAQELQPEPSCAPGRNPYLDSIVLCGGLHELMALSLSAPPAHGFPSIAACLVQARSATSILLDLSTHGSVNVSGSSGFRRHAAASRGTTPTIVAAAQCTVLPRVAHATGSKPMGLTKLKPLGCTTALAAAALGTSSSSSASGLASPRRLKKQGTSGRTAMLASGAGTASSSAAPGFAALALGAAGGMLPPPPPPVPDGPHPPANGDLRCWDIAKELEMALGSSTSRYWCYKAVKEHRGDANSAMLWVLEHPEPRGYGDSEQLKARVFYLQSQPAALSIGMPSFSAAADAGDAVNNSSRSAGAVNTSILAASGAGGGAYGPVIDVSDEEDEEDRHSSGEENDNNDQEATNEGARTNNNGSSSRRRAPSGSPDLPTSRSEASDGSDNESMQLHDGSADGAGAGAGRRHSINASVDTADHLNESVDDGMGHDSAAVRFDECIVEGIAYNEPLIVDTPPRLPYNYQPVSKAQLLAAGQQGRALLNSVGATSLTRSFSSGPGGARKPRKMELAGVLGAAAGGTDGPSWQQLQKMLSEAGVLHDDGSTSMDTASGGSGSNAAGGGGGLLGDDDEMSDMGMVGGPKPSSASAAAQAGASATASLVSWTNRTAREYFAACGLPRTGLRHLSAYIKTVAPIGNFPAPMHRIGIDSQALSPATMAVALPRCAPSCLPRGTLVWVAARRSEDSVLEGIRIASKATGTHERLVKTCTAAITAVKAYILQLSCVSGGEGVLASIVRHYRAELSPVDAVAANAGAAFLGGSASSSSHSQQWKHRLTRKELLALHDTPPTFHPNRRVVDMTTVRIGGMLLDVPSDWMHVPTHLHGACLLDEPVVTTGAAFASNSEVSTGACALQVLAATSYAAATVKIARSIMVTLLLTWPSHLGFTLSSLSIDHNMATPQQILATGAITSASSTPSLLPSGSPGHGGVSASRSSNSKSKGRSMTGARALLSLLKLVAADEGVLTASGAIVMLPDRAGAAGNAASAGADGSGASSGGSNGGRGLASPFDVGRLSKSAASGGAGDASGGGSGGAVTTALRSQVSAMVQAEAAGLPFAGTGSSGADSVAQSIAAPDAASASSSSAGMVAAPRRVWVCPASGCGRINDTAEPSTVSSGSRLVACASCHFLAPPLPLISQPKPARDAGAGGAAASASPLLRGAESAGSMGMGGPPAVGASSTEDGLATVLVKDCLFSLVHAADACARASVRAATKQTTHPIASMRYNYESGTVHLPGATALWLTFDPRCATDPSDESSFLEIYACKSSTSARSASDVGSNAKPSDLAAKGTCVAHFAGPGHMFQPVMVAADTIHWVVSKGRAQAGKTARSSVADGGWGVQFMVTPLTGMAWDDDVSVCRQPSLLWGTWLLDFLLCGGLDHSLLSRGILHNGRILSTLIDYLRTAGAPYKERVIALLHRLLASPEYLLLTPRHQDYRIWGTAEAVQMLVANGVPSRQLQADAEKALLQRITAVPIDAVNVMRGLALELKARAEASNVMFLPRPLQRLLELVATADSAIKRARMQMHFIAATHGGIYADASGSRAAKAQCVPLTAMPTLNDEGKLLLSTGARCDAGVPSFDPALCPSAGQGLLTWQPPLVLVKPQLITTMPEMDALTHLRDVLVSVTTGRRVPDAWMLRALLLATRQDPNDLTGVTVELVAEAHKQSAAFTLPEDEAAIAWMGSYAARKNASGALEIQPSQMIFTESDASSYPLLEKFRVRSRIQGRPVGEMQDDICGLGLRVRVSFFLILNTLLKRCIQSIDVTPWTDEVLSISGGAGGGGSSGASAISRVGTAGTVASSSGGGLGSGAAASSSGPVSDLSMQITVAVEGAITGSASIAGSAAVAAASSQSAGSTPAGTPLPPPPLSPDVLSIGSPLHHLHTLTVGAMLRRIPHCVLVDAKEALIVKAIEATETPGTSGIKVQLDNRTAMASTEHCVLDPMASLCTFAQLVRHMMQARVADKQLRCRLSDRETLFEVGYVGLTGNTEEGLDWGGMYRETLARCMEDLFGDNRGIDLFVLAPNAAAARMADGGGGAPGGGGAAGAMPVPLITSVGDGSFVPNPRYCPANVVGAASGSKGAGSASSGNPTSAAAATAMAALAASGQSAQAGPITAQALALVSQMYAWVGRLMGISVRTRSSDMEVDLSCVVWKLLVGEPIGISDVASLDSRLGAYLQRLRDWSFDAAASSGDAMASSRLDTSQGGGGGLTSEGKESKEDGMLSSPSHHAGSSSSAAGHQHHSQATIARAAEAAFATDFGSLVFVLPESALTGFVFSSAPTSAAGTNAAAAAAASVGGTAVVRQHYQASLMPGGATTPVTLANRHRYISLIIQAAVAPYAHAVACMRAGMASVVPDRAISLCGWRDLLRLVCGDSAVDIENLYRNSKYDGAKYYHEAHPVIINFWKAMRELTPEQKRNFVRFAWGRSRLPRGRWPTQANGQQVKFTIVPRRGHKSGIPLSHTCFFLIELPEYPDMSSLRRNLLLAITYGAGEAFLIA